MKRGRRRKLRWKDMVTEGIGDMELKIEDADRCREGEFKEEM